MDNDDEMDVNEPPAWHPPVRCPSCGSTETRFLEPRYERAIYECEACRTRFEDEG